MKMLSVLSQQPYRNVTCVCIFTIYLLTTTQMCNAFRSSIPTITCKQLQLQCRRPAVMVRWFSEQEDTYQKYDNTRIGESIMESPLLLVAKNETPVSFTSKEYIDIVHSSNILRLFVFHATMYYTLAIIGFSYLVESWSIIDSLYYATVLFCTIGFGDIEPGNVNAQLYTIFLAIYGVAFLGILLGAVIDYCFEYQNYQSEQHCRQVGSQVLHQLKEKSVRNRIDKDTTMNTKVQATFADTNDDNTINCEQIIKTTANPPLWDDIKKLIVLEAPILSVAILLAIGIGHYEGWTIFESIYWFVISGATVGFGDYYPQMDAVKLFCVLYLPFSVAVLGDLLRRIIGIYLDRKRRSSERQFLERSLTLADLDVMDTDHNSRVDKAEFLAYMLCTLQKVSKEDVDDIMELFHKLDIDNDEYLTKGDLISDEWIQSLRTSLEQSMCSIPRK